MTSLLLGFVTQALLPRPELCPPIAGGFYLEEPSNYSPSYSNLNSSNIEADVDTGYGCIFDVFTTPTSSLYPMNKESGGLVRLPEFEHCYVAESNDFVLPDLGAWRAAISTTTITLSTENPTIKIEDDIGPPVNIFAFFKSLTLSPSHELKVMELWNMIKNRGSIRHFTPIRINQVIVAIRVAYVAFWGKKTFRSLEVLINRSRGTAAVLGELKADADVIIAGILHDIFAQAPPEGVEEMHANLLQLFGEQVTTLVRSYSHLPNFNSRKTQYTLEQSENQVQMLVAHAEDYRVLYIRLADRLHSMRVLRSLPIDVSEREKIATEALNVYAPLAHKMGIIKVKGELEDLAFRVLNPELFQRSKYTQTAAHKAFHEASEAIDTVMRTDDFLRRQNVTYRLHSRIKDKYQLALKMKRKRLQSMNDVKDALGLRIILDMPRAPMETEAAYTARTEECCYYIVEQLMTLRGWRAGALKDYIKVKKPNGYASLHLFLKNTALGTNVEVQVRTRQMHLVAELGEAAHWNYKDNLYRWEVASSKLYRIAWRSPEQLNAKSSAELLGLAKKQLNAQRVFVFLEDESTVLNLRKGATALDAAFAIHSKVGLSTKSISVSGASVNFQRVLQSGDVIAVEVDKTHSVAQPSWARTLRLPHSQAVLRKYLREKRRSMVAVLGCVQLIMTLTINKDLIRQRFFGSFPTVSQLRRYTHARAGLRNLEELLVHLGISSMVEVGATMGRLLDIPADKVTVFSTTGAVLWTREQSKRGFDDPSLRLDTLAPLLKEIMLTCNIEDIQERWYELIGTQAVVVQVEPAVNDKPRFIFKATEPYEPSQELSRNRKIHMKSEILKAQKPFSLEAASMSGSLQRLAKANIGAKIRISESSTGAAK